MKVWRTWLVCGSRHAKDPGLTERALERRRKSIDCVLVGGAPGVDSFAERWAKRNGIPVLRLSAYWTLFGKKAGPIRNEWMLRFGKPDRVLALPGGAGTENMVEQARAWGITVTRVRSKR